MFPFRIEYLIGSPDTYFIENKLIKSKLAFLGQELIDWITSYSCIEEIPEDKAILHEWQFVNYLPFIGWIGISVYVSLRLGTHAVLYSAIRKSCDVFHRCY